MACSAKVAGGLGRKRRPRRDRHGFLVCHHLCPGQVAKRYYVGGRQMSSNALLKESFDGMLGQAKEMQTRYMPEMTQKAATLNANQIMSMVRG